MMLSDVCRVYREYS